MSALSGRPPLLARWQTFWFTEIPPDIYALLRIVFGALGLINLLAMTPVSMLWTPDGVMPLPGGGFGLKAELIDLGVAAAAGRILFSVLLASFASMMVGFLSALAVAVCFSGSVLQAFWNPLPRNGADGVLIVILFCLLWADCGARLSVDARLALRHQPRDSGVTVGSQAIWPLRLLQIQIALIYLNSGLWKLFGETWRDGTAIHYALSYNLLQRFPFAVPAGLDRVLTAATYGTLFWEIGFLFMLFHPWTRRIALLTGVLVHGGIWVMLEIGVFSWLMIGSYLAFLDPNAVGRVLSARRRNGRRLGAV